MEREKVKGAAVITFISLIYFMWLMVVVLKERGYILPNADLFLSLREWAIIGIILYAVFLIIEIFYYLSTPKKEEGAEGIKLVSAVIKKVFCNNCNTVFSITDTGVRPLRYTCPNCGGEGALRGKIAEGIRKNIKCGRCENLFEIYDTGERPLKYECPECHFEGAVSS
ncbi:MAG: hypothetical protein U9O96_02970 [Candidatus Thermoplasmatota archaeon]|nr:hypothetical protein [Candidatus Thermoplasmatota archaeon]